MIKSVKGTATRQFIEGGKSKFSGLNVALAQQRLAELNAAASSTACARCEALACTSSRAG